MNSVYGFKDDEYDDGDGAIEDLEKGIKGFNKLRKEVEKLKVDTKGNTELARDIARLISEVQLLKVLQNNLGSELERYGRESQTFKEETQTFMDET